MARNMITDNIMGLSRKYDPTRKPIIVKYGEDPSALDPDLKKLRHVMVRNTQDNREYCFWSDSISQSFAYITAATILGSGLRITCKNQKALDIINGWNREININRKGIEDWVTSTWIDEIVHGHSYWRIELTREHPYGVDIQRLDPKTITKKKDPKYGWVKFIQQVADYKSYRSKASFYARAGLYNDLDQIGTYSWRTRAIHIQDEPDVLLRTGFFIQPPIASALHYITYKRYILYFMRKFSQKFWTPFILFLVGDPRTNYYPENPEDMQEQIDDVAEVVPKIVNFGGLVLPGNVRTEELGKNTARASDFYVRVLEALDKQIMWAMYGSMGLRDSSGNELSTQRGVMEGWYQFIQGIRRKYKVALENFYVRCLLPANNVKIQLADLDVGFPPLKVEASEEYMRAVQLGRATGMFKDRNELRKAGQTVWNWLEELPENPKVDFQIPVQTSSPMGGAGTAPSTRRSLAQGTKQANKTTASTTTV